MQKEKELTEKFSQKVLKKIQNPCLRQAGEIRNTNLHSQKAHLSHFFNGFLPSCFEIKLRPKSQFSLNKLAVNRDIFRILIYSISTNRGFSPHESECIFHKSSHELCGTNRNRESRWISTKSLTDCNNNLFFKIRKEFLTIPVSFEYLFLLIPV